MAAVFLVMLFYLFSPVLPFSDEAFKQFRELCPSFTCGNSKHITFPFNNNTRSPTCGPFVVMGCDKDHQEIQLMGETGRRYQVESITRTSISLVDNEFGQLLNSGPRNQSFCECFNNFSLPNFPEFSFQIIPNITLLKCDHNVTLDRPTDFNYSGCTKSSIPYNNGSKSLPSLPPNCSIIQPHCSIIPLPIEDKSKKQGDTPELLAAKFTLQVDFKDDFYKCHFFCKIHGLECQLDKKGEFQECTPGDTQKNSESRLILVVPAAAAGLGLLIIIGLYLFTFRWKIRRRHYHTIEAILKNHGPLAIKRYSYSEIKKMTESFKNKLGQGGYGSVFKGKLLDGHLVAVKVLKVSESDGEEFMNEVASISRTSHINVVTLLGFCFEGSKRALVYEFMPNGSLDKYIHKEEPQNAADQLGWETLYEIALGTARGLEYLHRGCNTRILHFDIKPHNILLDQKFRPKISDFGLAKVCLKDESFVSMLGARGTAGYIAPEVFCRSFGAVSHKSDVYSYGMLVLEMVGGRKNISPTVDHSSEIYFPQWIYKRLELGEELDLRGLGTEEERQVQKKLILVSLWCIQTNPSNRPTMTRVTEMLQGSHEFLPMPPRPFLSSPSRSPHRDVANSSTTCTILTL